MNLDADNRLLPPGEYREATNITVINSEGSDVGTVQKSYSNVRLTNLSLGTNPHTIFEFAHESRDRMYWGVKSDNGCYIVEWDDTSQSAAFVLQDTRSLATRVLNFNENFLCTGVDIIVSEDEDRELMVLTDDNMQPLCFNISRAKNYAVNGFDEEDILLIKKPPRFEPTIQLTYTGGKENFLKEEMLTFCYRYKYLDGEYSAFSGFTNYSFAPTQFNLDYLTVENIGMLNNFNAVRIGFNTGDKRVTEIQLIVKKSNSNTPYIIENFNKEREGWADDTQQSFLFSNNKTLIALPEKELYRLFDNVPLKAKALTVIGNKINYGNYVEGYNIVDANNSKINMDYSLDIIRNSLQGENVLTILDLNPSYTDIGSTTLEIDFSGLELTAGRRITFQLFMAASQETSPGVFEVKGQFNGLFDYILNESYDNAEALAESEEFILFIDTLMNNVFTANYTVTVPTDSSLTDSTPISFTASGDIITLTAPVFTYTNDMTSAETEYTWGFLQESVVTLLSFSVSSSLKTNRSLEVGLIYLDKYSRYTTVLTGKTNTIFIPQDYIEYQNKLKVIINHEPPACADRYKVVVKHAPLSFQTIYGVLIYEDGPYRWIRLDGANKDKVKEDDILILKADQNGPRTDVFQVPIIEIKDQEANFLSLNTDESGQEIVEEPGKYMKIKADGIAVEANGNSFFQGVDFSNINGSECRIENFMNLPDTDTPGDYIDIALPAGSRINIKISFQSNNYSPNSFDQSFVAQNEYDSFEDWFNVEFPGIGAIGEYIELVVDRFGNNGLYIQVNPLVYTGTIAISVTVQLSSGLLVFETEPKSVDTEIFYETGQTFEIIDGKHQANLQNQTDALPAEIESSFFNCFTFGNGVESYRVKDLLNKTFLNIDLKPNAASIEPYRQVRRIADITYSEAYIESANLNGLNVFNLSTANFKELEKAYGSIQKLHSRDTNIVVLQEEKAGQVLYEKNAVFTATNNAAITSSPGILGEYIPYGGRYGIARNPESFTTDDSGRVYYASPRKGAFVRLSNDGVEPVIYGLKDFFRDLFSNQPYAKKISGYDPYLNKVVFSIGNEPERLARFNCGATILKYNQSVSYSYELRLNDLGGDIIISYNITDGNATITADFNGSTYVVSNVTGVGNLIFERDSLVENIVTVTVTPVSENISYELGNTCPVGSALKIVNIVLNDSEDTSTTMRDRFKKQGGGFISTDELFTDGPITRFEALLGTEGVGNFPLNGDLITIQAFKDTINSGHFALSECNRLGYLISETEYDESDINTILDEATFITVTTTGEEDFSQTSAGSFIFNRSNTDEILYLIWDYTSRNPVISNDTANVYVGESVIIDVLANDEVGDDAVVTVATQPNFGTAVANPDGTITYTHNGSANFNDSFTYTVTEGGCSSTATVSVNIGISCGDTLNANGNVGIYEVLLNFGTETGYCGIQYNAQGIPDRFQLYWNDVLVADSKYVGDSLSGIPPGYTGLLGEHTLDIFEFNGVSFDDTGNDDTITVIQDDIANNTTEPTDGSGFLVFNKTTALPATARLVTTGPVSSTAWGIIDVICPTPAEELVDGEAVFVYGFFTEANKDNTTKSIKLFRGTSPDKFYTNEFGDTNFSMYNEIATNKFLNDGTDWYEIDTTGNIINSGSL